MANATELYNIVKDLFYTDDGYNLHLTGSAALKLILQEAEFDDILLNLSEPNDTDFLYIGRSTQICRKKKIGDFTNRKKPHRSATFTNSQDVSFDLTLVPVVRSICIGGIKVIDPESLLKYYQDDIDGIDPTTKKSIATQKKISALLEAIKRIYKSDDLSDRLLWFDQRERQVAVDYGETSRVLVFG